MFNTIKFIFGSLFSNRRLVDESNEHPIWLALIIFLLSLCAAVLPMTITSLNVQGSQILTVTENYSLDYSLSVLSRDYLYTNGGVETEDQVVATIRDDQLQLNVPTFEADIKFPDDDKVSLAVRYTSDQTQVSSIIQDIKTSYIVPNEEATDDTLISEVPSMLIFTPSNYYIYLYAGTARVSFTETNGEVTITSDATASTGISGNYVDIPDETCLNDFYDKSIDESDALQNTYDGWVDFLNKGYQNPRNYAVLTSSLMFLGIDVAIVFILALVLFLLSKTKASPRKIPFLEALKIDMFATLSPAIIGMLIGFLWADFFYLGFIIIYGIRATFLGMKATSPNQNNPEVRK